MYAQHGQHVFTLFGARSIGVSFQPLHLFVGDRVEMFRTERWNQLPLAFQLRSGLTPTDL
jgi:hypothetical protein